MTLHTFHQWASLIVLLTSCGFALSFGGRPERLSAVAMILAWFASAVLMRTAREAGLDIAVMTVDIVLFLVVLAISLTSDRWWPMWASAFLGLIVLVHLAVMLDPKIWGRAYFAASNLFSYLTMFALLIGSLSRASGQRQTSAPDAASPLT